MSFDAVSFDAVLCDLDGVLRHFRPMADLERRHGVPPGALAAAAFAPARLLPAITGAHSDEEWRAGVAEAVGSATLVAEWSADPGELDPAVVEILRLARADGPVVLVTNATTRLAADAAALGLHEHADAIVSSAELGFAKPDPRVYQVAAEVAEVPVARCLFVDDSAANVDAATELGMQGLIFRRPEEFRELVSLRSARRAGSPPGPAGTPPPGPRS